jgi:hypothetical protein
MKTLIVIPHAYLTDTPAARMYGCERTDPAARAAALLRCVSALHQTFGSRQHLVGARDDPRCNAATESALEVVLVTAGTQHLADTLPPHLVHHKNTTLHPRLLGFACQGILRDNAGRFDWYGYLEDDCEITDALFFCKLAWFNATFGQGVLLQPNRFELSSGMVVQKLYIDGRIQEAQPWLGMPGERHLAASLLGQRWRFRRVSNPHSGCFFVSQTQMAHLAADPLFGRYSEAFIGPLESAATVPIMRNFAVYKPALENAAFLEMRHIDQRLLDQRLFFRVNEAGEIVRSVTEAW